MPLMSAVVCLFVLVVVAPLLFLHLLISPDCIICVLTNTSEEELDSSKKTGARLKGRHFVCSPSATNANDDKVSHARPLIDLEERATCTDADGPMEKEREKERVPS
jgi:hypothetical protein